jgi:hypothetical protein
MIANRHHETDFPMDLSTFYVTVAGFFPSAEVCAAYAGAASAFFAAVTIRSTAKARKNERLLGDAVRTLERSFIALVDQTPVGKNPPNDRLGWLTSARLIEQYKEAKKQINDRVILKECESHEEHWRHQFYLRLKNLAGGTPEYYSKGGSIECINEVSAVIVHAFADWQRGKEDPLFKYKDTKDAVKKLVPLQRWFALHQYCGTLVNRPETER